MNGSRKRFGTKMQWIVAAVFLAAAAGWAQLPPRLQPGQLPPPPPGQPAPKSSSSQNTADSTPSRPSDESAQPASDLATNPDPNAIRVTTRTVLVPTTVKDKDTGSFVN